MGLFLIIILYSPGAAPDDSPSLSQTSHNDELAKTIKRLGWLGFPDLAEAAKPSSILGKALDSITKRLKQTDEIRGLYNKLIGAPDEPTNKTCPQLLNQTACQYPQNMIAPRTKPSELTNKTCTQLLNQTPCQHTQTVIAPRMKLRLDAMYTKLDEGHDQLQAAQSKGLLDGFTKQLFVGTGVVGMFRRLYTMPSYILYTYSLNPTFEHPLGS